MVEKGFKGGLKGRRMGGGRGFLKNCGGDGGERDRGKEGKGDRGGFTEIFEFSH